MVDSWIWLVPVAAALALAGLALSPRFAWGRRRRRDHLVVIGAGDTALALLRATPDPSHSILLADRDRAGVADAAHRLGANVVIGPLDETLRDAALARARWIAFVGEDSERNLALAAAVFAHLAASGAAARERTVLFEAASVDRRIAAERRADEGSWARFARILPFDLASLAARQALADHPLDAVRLHPVRPPRIGISGGSALAEALLQALARRGWREPASRLRVVVATADGGRWMADQTARHPALRELLHLEEVTEIPADVDEVFAVDLEHERNFRTLARVLESARAMGKRVPRLRCAMPAQTATGSGRAPGADPSDAMPEPVFFADASRDFRSALAREETLERMGRAVHELYLEECERSGERLGARPSLRPWVELPEAMKEDNRRQVDGFEASLREIGWRIAPTTGVSRQPFSDVEAEHLGRREHERWMAARMLAGWRAGSPRDDAARIHPDLVRFSELPEERRRLSRDAIRRIPLVFERFGRSVVADVVVAVPADAVESADRNEGAAAAGRTMEELRHAYPGRHVHLLSSIGTPFELGFCTAAMAEGATLAIVDGGPFAAQAAALDRQEMTDVEKLDRAAECRIVPADDRARADRGDFFRAVAAAQAHVHARGGR